MGWGSGWCGLWGPRSPPLNPPKEGVYKKMGEPKYSVQGDHLQGVPHNFTIFFGYLLYETLYKGYINNSDVGYSGMPIV